jgi:hypothetical protein
MYWLNLGTDECGHEHFFDLVTGCRAEYWIVNGNSSRAAYYLPGQQKACILYTDDPAHCLFQTLYEFTQDNKLRRKKNLCVPIPGRPVV